MLTKEPEDVAREADVADPQRFERSETFDEEEALCEVREVRLQKHALVKDERPEARAAAPEALEERFELWVVEGASREQPLERCAPASLEARPRNS